MGLVLSGCNVALRVTKEADLKELEAQLRHSLQDNQAAFRMATPGQQWWRLGPLTESETWRVKDLIIWPGWSLSEEKSALQQQDRSAVWPSLLPLAPLVAPPWMMGHGAHHLHSCLPQNRLPAERPLRCEPCAALPHLALLCTLSRRGAAPASPLTTLRILP